MKRWLAEIAQLWWKLIRFGFRLLYNELAFTYDTVSKIVSMGAWRCWQRSVLKHLDLASGSSVLEIAHGTGDLQLDLKAAGYRSVGVDLSPYMGRIASRKLKRHHIKSVLVRGRAQQLPFASGSFSAVVVTFPTDFILLTETLNEAHRLLTQNGVLVIVPNGTFTGGGIIRKFLEWLYTITGQRSSAKKGDSADAESHLHARISEHFHKHGFDVSLHEETCPRSRAQVIVARKKV